MANEINLVWNVYDYNYNRDLRIFNVFRHGSFMIAVEKLLKMDIPKEEFSELLRRQAQYYYWAKSECAAGVVAAVIRVAAASVGTGGASAATAVGVYRMGTTTARCSHGTLATAACAFAMASTTAAACSHRA